MNPEQMQEENNMPVDNEMTAEEAKASLGLATRLSEQMLMMQAPQEAPVEPETPQNEEKTIRDEYPAQDENNEKLDMVLDEIASIKEEIAKALEEPEEENENAEQK